MVAMTVPDHSPPGPGPYLQTVSGRWVNPFDPDPAQIDAGDIARATPELEAAARMVPREAQFQFALGNAYARAGRKEDAARARAAFVRLRTNESTPAPDAKDGLRRLDLDGAGLPASKN